MTAGNVWEREHGNCDRTGGGEQTFCGVRSWPTTSCRPLRMRFSEMVLRSLFSRIESMIGTYCSRAPGETRRERNDVSSERRRRE